MGLSDALGIAGGGLSNVSLGLAVISQNVANASTAQYAVERATQQSVSAGGQGEGVSAGVVLRATDTALQAQVSTETSQSSAAQITSGALSALQPVLGTVGGGTDLGSLLTNVQSAFSSLLGDPGDATQQGAVVASAVALARGINTLAQDTGQARQSAQDGLVTDVASLNTSLGQVGALNRQIVSLKAQGQSTADLENQRDQAENSISKLVNARFLTQTNGSVTVLTVSGVQLPTDVSSAVSIASATVGAASTYPSTLPGLMVGGSDVTAQMTGGSIGARVTLRDSTLPGYQASLDEFSESLSNRFAAQGLTLFFGPAGTVPASTAPPLQSGYVGYSATIQVNPAVIANSALVRDGTQSVTGSPTGASAFAPNTSGLAGFTTMIGRVLDYALGSQVQSGVAQTAIATSGLGQNGTLNVGFGPATTLGDYANSRTATQAADSSDASAQATDAQSVVTTLQSKLTGETGVSMDTELGLMVVLQNAYGANAKIISAIQSLFSETLAMVT